ncbi:MAG: DivIVA domain-containing protein [Clostridiales bacterium]|nr:DivIVA domain-containing protein [Clostridiales bacterium]
MRTEEIVNKVFTRAFMGYDIEQVDVFLDEVIEALERYEAEKREMLAAMEYLMKKLERGQQVPLSDMKKAIDSGRAQPKKAQPEDTAGDEEPKTSARSIARGAGAGKPMRAPKVSRVKRGEEARAQIIEEAKAAQPAQPELTPEEAEARAKRIAAAAANWLDELLINIAEHESSDFDQSRQGEQADGSEPPEQDESEAKGPEPQEDKPEA